MLHNTLQAAEQQRALVVLPGTVYNYGPDAFPLIAEEAAQQPVTRKGAIRVEMELALEDYVQRGGRALIVRAGDFFGPRAGNNWFSQGLVKPGQLPASLAARGRSASGISGLICPTSPTPPPRCWPAGMSLSRLLVFICRATGTRTAAK